MGPLGTITEAELEHQPTIRQLPAQQERFTGRLALGLDPLAGT